MKRAQRRTGAPRSADVDWVSVRCRLAAAAIRDSDALTPEQAEAILAQRARALASTAVPVVDRSARLDALVVRIAGERYALAAEYVWRMVGAAEVTPVPGAPENLRGVINLHGEVLPVFEPRLLLGRAPEPLAPRCRVVMLGSDRADLGLVVDAAEDVVRLAIEQLQAAPDAIAQARRDLLRGVMQDGLILLDGAKLMTDPRLVVAARTN